MTREDQNIINFLFSITKVDDDYDVKNEARLVIDDALNGKYRPYRPNMGMRIKAGCPAENDYFFCLSEIQRRLS
jgi:hypothetical protein